MEKGKSSEEKYSIFMSGIPFSANEKDIIEFIKDCGTPIRVFLPKYQDSEKCRGYAHVEFKSVEEMNKALELNGKHIGERYIKVERSRGPRDKDRDEHHKRATVFVKGLPYTTKEDDIKDLFKEKGKIKAIRMISDWTTKEFKGFCFIEFESQEDASAVVKMDGMEMGGRRLKIDFDSYKPKHEHDQRDRDYDHDHDKREHEHHRSRDHDHEHDDRRKYSDEGRRRDRRY